MEFTKCLLQAGSSGGASDSGRSSTRGGRCLSQRRLRRVFQKPEAGNRRNIFRTMRRSSGLNLSVTQRGCSMDKTMDKMAVLDLPGALSRADGDQDLFLILAGLFLQESPKEVAAARAALNR